MLDNNYRSLLLKIDEFIRKYYKNQVLRGLIYSITAVLLFYISIILLEYYAHFDTTARTILFYAFVLVTTYILGRLVVIPFLHLYKLGKIISYDQAAVIIGTHFRNQVNDKLINTLQLKTLGASSASTSLIEASIHQKIKELSPIPFAAAIDLSQNKKYLKYALIPISLIGLILFSAPSIITDGTKRLVEHQTYFEKTAPFKFNIQNKSLKAIQQEDFLLDLKITGEEIPENVYIEIENNEYKLNKDNTVSFNYLFKNVQENVNFRLFADGYSSREYELEALPNPILLNFSIQLTYPKYIKKKDEVLNNTGDLIIPSGTKVGWNFTTKNTKVLMLNFNDTAFSITPQAENNYTYYTQLFKDKTYSVSTLNDFLKSKDSVVYTINVIPDFHPSIVVDEKRDSLSNNHFVFQGNIKDDYGFNKLNFVYKFLSASDSLRGADSKTFYEPIAINKSLNQEQFFHFWDISRLTIEAGDEIEYFFEVWDNDGVNGSKSSRTQKQVFKAPTLKEIAQHTEKKNKEIKNELEESIKEAQSLQKELNDLNKKILEKKSLSWEEKKKMISLLEKQKNFEKKIESIKNENIKNNREQSEFKEPDPSLVEKQRQIEELFENIISEEMKEKFKELEKLLEKLDKNEVQKAIENLKLDNKDIEKELDRTLEIFKQLEFQKKLEETISKVEELSKKQENLGDKSLEKNAENKQLEEKQNELNKEFDDVKKDLNDLEKKNAELERPSEMKDTEGKENEIQQEMKNSSEQLQNNKNNKASQSQKNASKKLQELSQELAAMQSEMEQQNSSEDMDALRAILENLIRLSFDQESLMGEVAKTKTDNPYFNKLTQTQKKLQDDSKMIEDSLLALSKRVPQIQSTVNKEISSIHMNMGKSIEYLSDAKADALQKDRLLSEATGRQQFAMTSVNNLALLLNEALQQMQEQARDQKPGSGSCKKPGGKGKKPSPSMSSLRKMQEQLNQQLEQLKKSLEKGGKQSGGKQGISEELARMAAQQEAIRQQLQKAADELNKNGKEPGGNLNKLAEKMEKTETDLVNKAISQETLMRQQEILTRLLESEKAEKEREMDEKRQANEAKNEIYSNPNEFLEYKKQKLKEVELLKTVPPSLIPFYKNKVNEYFNTFEVK